MICPCMSADWSAPRQEKRLSELKVELDRKLDEDDRAKQQRSAQVQAKLNAAKKARKEAADAIAYVLA
jgi:hypothetical protein